MHMSTGSSQCWWWRNNKNICVETYLKTWVIVCVKSFGSISYSFLYKVGHVSTSVFYDVVGFNHNDKKGSVICKSIWYRWYHNNVKQPSRSLLNRWSFKDNDSLFLGAKKLLKSFFLFEGFAKKSLLMNDVKHCTAL